MIPIAGETTRSVHSSSNGKKAGIRFGIGVPRILFAIVESLMAVAPSLADIRILSSVGGEVGEYLKLFEAFRQSGEQIVIDGPCYSACTLVLATIPQDRICVTRKAVLGFHAARLRDENGRIYSAPEATRVVAAGYPAGVRAWINRHGGLTGKTIFLRGRELAALYRRCR